MNFGLTLTEVLLMFAYAVPGYLLVKSRLVGEKAIPGFAALLMYVLQPCLCIDSFRQITYTPEAFSRMAWFFIICLVQFKEVGKVLLEGIITTLSKQ